MFYFAETIKEFRSPLSYTLFNLSSGRINAPRGTELRSVMLRAVGI